MTGWADVLADRQGVVNNHYTLYSVCGTGVGWNVGYPYDIGEALEEAGLVDHQPVEYGPDGVPNAFPMEPSIQSGVAELTRLILLRDPSTPWALIGYSQGAIVTSLVFDLVRTVGHPLNAYLASFIGAVTFGNPRREAGHTVPGGIDPGGSGIVTPNMVDTPESWWDFADGKAMVNSPGNDLYTTCGAGEDALAQTDQRAIWTIVDQGTLASLGDLEKQVLDIIPHPLSGGLAAAEAAIGALDFFVAEGITPHTSYQFVQPVVGDPRDCWRMALDYLTTINTNPSGVNMTAPTATVPAAASLDLTSIEAELKAAVSGLVAGLSFIQKFDSLPGLSQYATLLSTVVKVLTVLEGLL